MSGWLQGIKSFIFGKDNPEPGQAGHPSPSQHSSKRQRSGGSGRGGRGSPDVPVIQDAGYSTPGGIQGLGWYTDTMTADGDGDAAHGFIAADVPGTAQQEPGPRPARCRLLDVVKGNVLISEPGAAAAQPRQGPSRRQRAAAAAAAAAAGGPASVQGDSR